MSRILNGIDLTLDRPIQLNRNAKPRAMLNGLSGRATEQIWNGYEFAPPELNSVLYLPGYPGSGSTIFDYSGNGNNGTITGATWERLPSGLWANKFDGAGDRITCAPVTTVGTSNFTVIMWFKVGLLNTRQIMFRWGGSGAGSHDGFLLELTVENIWGFWWWSGVSPSSNTPVPIVGDWHFLCGTYDGTNAILYIDGALKQSLPYSLSNLVNTGYVIGDYATGGALPTTGNILLVRLATYAKTASQISNLFQQERYLFGV